MTDHVQTLINLQELDNKIAQGKVENTPYRKRKRKQLVSGITEALARTYNRLHVRHTNAVVPVVNGVCQGCFVHLPAWLSAALDDPRDEHHCDHCGRIVYLPGRG